MMGLVVAVVMLVMMMKVGGSSGSDGVVETVVVRGDNNTRGSAGEYKGNDDGHNRGGCKI